MRVANGQFAAVHGHAVTGQRSSTYRSWEMMRARCTNPEDEHYPDYGGRGIFICAEWDEFSVFLKDMGDRPENMTLERKDVNGPYTKGNCVWATKKEQARNRRNSIFVTLGGESVNLAAFAEKHGIEYSVIWKRYKAGATTAPELLSDHRQKITVEQADQIRKAVVEGQTQAALAKVYHTDPSTISRIVSKVKKS